MAQLVRAPPCHGGGQGFEPLSGRLLNNFQLQLNIWGLSSAGRASALQAEGHRFEPYRPHLNGWIPEWPKGTDCKSAATCFGGSNPPPSIGSWKRTTLYNIAGWSSLEARRAHNPKVVGSNPAPATSNNQRITLVIFFYTKWTQNKLLRYNRTISV